MFQILRFCDRVAPVHLPAYGSMAFYGLLYPFPSTRPQTVRMYAHPPARARWFSVEKKSPLPTAPSMSPGYRAPSPPMATRMPNACFTTFRWVGRSFLSTLCETRVKGVHSAPGRHGLFDVAWPGGAPTTADVAARPSRAARSTPGRCRKIRPHLRNALLTIQTQTAFAASTYRVLAAKAFFACTRRQRRSPAAPTCLNAWFKSRTPGGSNLSD